MNRVHLIIMIVCIAVSIYLLCYATSAMAEEEKTEKKEALMERIDFGNSYILGQSIKSGATYLLHRKKSDIKSMLKTREDYRNEILEDFKVNDES